MNLFNIFLRVLNLLIFCPWDGKGTEPLFIFTQDERPPITDSLSPVMTDFLFQCFKKVVMQMKFHNLGILCFFNYILYHNTILLHYWY